MHPHPAFRWEDRDAIRAFISEVAFGTLFAATPDGPRVAHVPVVWDGDDRIAFHLARGNALAKHLDGAQALFVANGPDAYISPEWYGEGCAQVPTWNYVAVELEGKASRMSRDAMAAQIDRLVEIHEARIDKAPWTVADMDQQHYGRMLDSIHGFRLDIMAWRGTTKLAQTKSDAARAAAADALEANGRAAIAHWMRHA